MKTHALFLVLLLLLGSPAIAQPTIIKGPALFAPSNSATSKRKSARDNGDKNTNFAEQLLFTLCSHHVIRPNPLV